MRGGFVGTGFIGVTRWDGVPFLLSVKSIVAVANETDGTKVSGIVLEGVDEVFFTKDSQSEILLYIQEEKGLMVSD